MVSSVRRGLSHEGAMVFSVDGMSLVGLSVTLGGG